MTRCGSRSATKGWFATRLCISRADGTKEILGLWLEQNEGSKFWLRVMNELKNSGRRRFDRRRRRSEGFPDAITAVFPQATVQTCVVHLLRRSLELVCWKDRKPVAAALRVRIPEEVAPESAMMSPSILI